MLIRVPDDITPWQLEKMAVAAGCELEEFPGDGPARATITRPARAIPSNVVSLPRRRSCAPQGPKGAA